jgi:hypothetical protein
MHRRQFLGAGVGAAALLAGCYEGGGDDADPTDTATATSTPTTAALALTIAGVSEGEDGALRATIRVENRAETERTGTVTVTARTGEETQTVTRDVTVSGGQSVSVTLTFSSLTRAAFAEDGGFPRATVSA